MSSGHTANSDPQYIYGWIVPWASQGSLEDFVVDGGIWSIDLKSHCVRAVEMSRIGPIELVG